MNIQHWILARREGRLAAMPLGMSLAMASFCDILPVVVMSRVVMEMEMDMELELEMEMEMNM